MAGFNTTQMAGAIADSTVSPFIVPAPASAATYPLLVKMFDCTANKSNGTLDVPYWGARPQVTKNLAEGTAGTPANYDLTGKTSIIAGMLDTTADITDQVIQDSGLLQSDMVNEMFENLYETIDKEVLGLFDGATNTSDHTGVNLTLALWFADRALFRAQKPRGQMVFVGSGNQLRDIQLALVNSAGGQQIAGAGNSIFESGVIDGYIGTYNGVAIIESGNVVEADASNDVGGFLGVVGSSTAATAPGEPAVVGVEFSGFGMGVWQPAQVESIRAPRKHGFEATVSARLGFKRIAEYMIRAVISKKAA